MKNKHIEREGSWHLTLARAVKKCTKSVGRGIGPARQSGTVDLDAIVSLDLPWRSTDNNFPVGLKSVFIAGTPFLTREIELSLALATHVFLDPKAKVVKWRLPYRRLIPPLGILAPLRQGQLLTVVMMMMMGRCRAPLGLRLRFWQVVSGVSVLRLDIPYGAPG